MQLRGRALGEWTLLTALLALLAGLSAWQGWLWRADQVVYDASLAFTSRPAPDDIVIVAVDEESLARVGRWPWRRAIHATLLERLTEAGAAAVGFDMILSEPDNSLTDDDAVFADAIRRNGRTVLPVVPQALSPGLLAEGLPIEPFRQTAAALGHIEIPFDADGIVRGVYLWGGIDEPRHPQFALALLKVSRGGTTPEAVRPPASAQETESAHGWYRADWLHPLFAGPPGTYRTVSYVDVLTGTVPADHLRDRIVLVGATAEGLGDNYPTPMSMLGRAMPGVEVHATVLDALRTHAIIDWLPPWQVALLSGIAILSLMLGLLILSPRDGLLFAAFVGVGTLVGAMLLLRWGHTWLPPGAVLLAGVLAYPLWSWRRLEAAQRFLDAELRELHAVEPTAVIGASERSVDPLENRIAIVRSATERQRLIRKARDDTMRFISHDIRSPLASIITIAEGARPQAGPDSYQRLRRAERYAQKALDLADDFFRLAKAEALDASKFETIDLSLLAHEAADEVWPQAERKRIQVTVLDETRREALVRGDRAQLARAVSNLLDNAVKFSPDQASVTLRLFDAGPWQELDVIDHGCGIAPEDMGRLFTRYGRIVREGQPATSGIGLGLIIVKTIIERHGGMITVDSTPDAGTTFRVRLPHVAADGA